MSEISPPVYTRREAMKRLTELAIQAGSVAATAGCTPLDLARFAGKQNPTERQVPRKEAPDRHDQTRSEWLLPSDIRILTPKVWNTWTRDEIPIPSERFPVSDLRHLIVHHTALKLSELPVIEQLKALCREGGLLPYHVVIGPDGVVYAREQLGISKIDSISVAPHAGSIMNRAAMGVCLLGDFESIDWKTGKKRPTDTVSVEALRSLAYILAQLQNQYQIKPRYGNDVIIPHQGVATLLKEKGQATDCPGSLIMERWDGVMGEVRRTARASTYKGNVV